MGFRFCLLSTTISYAQRWWDTLNHSQSIYGVMLKNTDPIVACFGYLEKFQKVKTFTPYLKFTPTHNFIKIVSKLLLKTVNLKYFLVCLESCYENILLYGTVPVLFEHWLKSSRREVRTLRLTDKISDIQTQSPESSVWQI